MRTAMVCIASAATCFTVALHADIQATTKDGGSVVVAGDRYGDGSGANQGSTLRRSWVTLDDTTCPLAIVGTGVSIRQSNKWFGIAGRVRPREAVSAFEIRFVLLDVFGEHLTSLSKTEIKDLDAGKEVILSQMRSHGRSVGADWRANWQDVREHLTVVSFVAHVRTQEGVVWQYDEKAIAERLRELGLMRTELWLKQASDSVCCPRP